ncbi:MAG: dihydrolipoamide acetyltransferase family protein [Eubacteriales bacterium]|nr:dihydrolipoamide acetyltransferase family protein [Eubacteriales bacterium]
MAHPIILPRQGQSVESCIITEWHKKVGDPVKVGDVLFSYETDKASFEETAKEDGTLIAVFFDADDDVPVLTTVGAIGSPGEDVSGLMPGGGAPAAAPEAPAAEAKPAAPEAPAAPVAAAPAAPLSAGVSPRARATAQRLGLDPALASGTGPNGRVIERDIFAARDAAPAVQAAREVPAFAPAAAAPVGGMAYEEVKLSKVRKVTARAMHESLAGMAQITHQSSFDATQMLALRARFKAAPEELGLGGITINDMILFAVSRVLKRHPDLNAHYMGETMRLFRHAHLGIAVDTPRGLLVPTLFDADTKSLAQVSREAKQLGKDAQGGSINPDILSAGGFTVTNLGALGIEMFTPIINPPQVAILGVNCAVDRVRVVDGQVTAYPAMGLSLTYDHRAVDGAPASRFLRDLVAALENIGILIAD